MDNHGRKSFAPKTGKIQEVCNRNDSSQSNDFEENQFRVRCRQWFPKSSRIIYWSQGSDGLSEESGQRKSKFYVSKV